MRIKLLLTFALLIISIKITAQEDDGVDLIIVDIPPITSDCSPKLNNEELKSCFTKSITQQIVSKINAETLQSQGLKSGIYKVDAFFTINKDGKVKNIKADFQNDVIVNEIKKAIKSIKKMTPAFLGGKPVSVNYVIPVKFGIN